MVSEKPDVTSLDIVERSEEAISLFERHILPQFPNKEKIRIIRSDAFGFLSENMWQDARQEASSQGLERQNRAGRSIQRGRETANREKMQGRYDYAFIDLWHDTADGLEMYLKAKRIENKLHTAGLKTKFAYWVEKSLLSAYRWTVFEKTLAECTTEEEALVRLSDDRLRREAGQTV